MNGCIFCRLVAGEIPATVVFEDDVAFAFMDINPIAEGHVLLIPRRHYETLDELPGDAAGRLLRHLPKLVRAVKQATRAEGVNVLQNNGAAARQEVPHVHFHLVPRRTGDAWHWNWPAKPYPDGRLAELAAAITATLE